jgi:hypothetical protein
MEQAIKNGWSFLFHPFLCMNMCPLILIRGHVFFLGGGERSGLPLFASLFQRQLGEGDFLPCGLIK